MEANAGRYQCKNAKPVEEFLKGRPERTKLRFFLNAWLASENTSGDVGKWFVLHHIFGGNNGDGVSSHALMPPIFLKSKVVGPPENELLCKSL